VKKGVKIFQRLLSIQDQEQRARAVLRLSGPKLARVVDHAFLQERSAAWTEDEMQLRGLIGTAGLMRLCGKGGKL